MDIKAIVVKNYLESLTESEELDMIFPILLESKGFVILSNPKLTKGFPQYGKDIVAVGKDFNTGKLTKFYFEIKGGKDRHVSSSTFKKDDGIKESLLEAKFKKFESSYPNFDNLPLKIILVHNGDLKAGVQEVFEGFIKTEFPENSIIKFERWGISDLVKYFSEYLFGAYLLTDQKTTKLFNRVLVNFNVNEGVSEDFKELLNLLIERNDWEGYKRTIQRKWVLLFESLKLVSFVIYSESKEYENLDIAKRYVEYLIIRFWFWILKNKLEKDKIILKYFNQIFKFFYLILSEYFINTLDLATIKDGLYSEKGGRYEEIGYTYRTFEYLKYLCFLINLDLVNGKDEYRVKLRNILLNVIKANSVSARPLLDIHSNVIIDILIILIKNGELDEAKTYLKEVLAYIKLGKENHDRLPDANNSIENVIKFTVTRNKPVYYSDSTSPLLSVLVEFVAILGLENEFNMVKKFVEKYDIGLGIFIPHHGNNSNSKHLIEDKINDLEEQLFSKSVTDGYQSELRLTKFEIETFDINAKLSFEDFKEKIKLRVSEFEYNYRTDEADHRYLRDLAHIHYLTPYFPDKWRYLIG
ncbi:hypothetical protein [Polaribacter sp. Hel_I_88]|uniref:hypothetical protein n=1 Tax=Polaribacter sp. Hel_I_88 TaxID=1250006 RepID=UPI00056352A9|nr:hypothetical protein [Polaribacter sp. Hel_I_88]